MTKPTVRLASNTDGEAIHQLLVSGGFDPETLDVMDWSNIHPYWLVAENGAGIIGSAQILAGKPIGRIEYLATKPDLNHTTRARVVKGLLEHAIGMLGMAGVGAAAGTVPFKLKSYKKVLKKRGAVMADQGNVFVKRLI